MAICNALAITYFLLLGIVYHSSLLPWLLFVLQDSQD